MPDKFIAEKFLEQTKFDKNDPSEALTDNASFIGYYGTQESLWESTVGTLKLQLEVREATVYNEIKGLEAKATAGAIDARVALDDDVQQIKKRLNLAKEQVSCYSNAVKAFADRGNNARSTGTWLRSEKNFITATHHVSSNDFSSEDKAEALKRVAQGR